MRIKRLLVTLVGVVQGVIGLLAGLLTGVLFFNLFAIQTMLNLSKELLPFYLLILGVFSFFSVLNSLFLIREGLEQQ